MTPNHSPAPLIEVRNVTKKFFYEAPAKAEPDRRKPGNVRIETTALHDVSLALMPGETIGIIGHNGSGKSSLLRMLAGITQPTSGTIVRNGKIGSVLELGSGFHPDLTGRENLLFGAAILGCKPQEVRAKTDEILAFSEIGDYIDVPVKFYSSGMYMRLAFGLVTHLNFDSYLFDEVMAVGDFSFRDKCFARLNQLKAAGKGFVLVSHNLSEVTQTCDRVYVLAKGSVLFSGGPVAAIQAYGQQQGNSHVWQDTLLAREGELAAPRQPEAVDRPAPEEISVQILRAAARAAGQERETTIFKRSDHITIEIEVNLVNITRPVNMGVNLSDIRESPLTAGSTHQTGADITEDGRYVFSWSFPLNIYRESIYYFNFYILKESSMQPLCFFPKLISIELRGERLYVGDTLVQLPIQQDDAIVSLKMVK